MQPQVEPGAIHIFRALAFFSVVFMIDSVLHSIGKRYRVEILGLFNVDDERFPIKSVHSWAKQNAPLILYPYLREQVFSLTSRAGFEGTLLPLFQVPTFSAKRA